MSSRAIDQPKNGRYNSSRLKTKASGRGINVGNNMVSSADWCLDSKMTGLLEPWGKFSRPLTRTCMPRITRVPQMTRRNQLTANHHSGVRRTPTEISTKVSPHGITVISNHAICTIERINDLTLLPPRAQSKSQRKLRGQHAPASSLGKYGASDVPGKWHPCRSTPDAAR